jgi:hypothetical protein
MSDKTTRFCTSAPVYCHDRTGGNNKWIEEAISEKYIKYYDYKGFSNIKEIGHGGFGKVYRANWKNPRNTLALKSLKYFNENNETAFEKLFYEVIVVYYILSSSIMNTFVIKIFFNRLD